MREKIMDKPLPVVQKAQPVSLAITPDQAIVVISREDYLKRNYGKIIWGATYPRTVSLYDDEDWAGYEKREQALKQKIREIVGLLEKDILYRSHHPKFKWIAGSNTLKARNELLGLSKQ